MSTNHEFSPRPCGSKTPVMLIAAFVILSVTALLGSLLAVSHLRSEGTAAPPPMLAGLHGVAALGGFGCLLLGLRGPARGLATGTSLFGIIAAVLVGLAALIGLAMLTAHLLKRRFAGRLIGIHATFAISGFVFLAAYVLLG
jgi:hypothetical protein